METTRVSVNPQAAFNQTVHDILKDPIFFDLMTEAVTVSPCDHVFNESSIAQCFARDKRCPLDRKFIQGWKPNQNIRQLAAAAAKLAKAEAPSDEAQAHFSRGKELYEKGKYTEATDALLKAIEINPNFEKASTLLDYCLKLSSEQSEPQSPTQQTPQETPISPEDLKEILSTPTLQPTVLQKLVTQVRGSVALKEKLFSFIEESKKDRSIAKVAAAAITILNLADVSFSGRDFQYIKVPEANLSYAILEGTDLRGADLSRVNFSGAILSRARLNRSRMRDVEFGQLPIITANDAIRAMISYSFARGSGLIAAIGSTIIMWDSMGEEIRTFEGHTGPVRALLLFTSMWEAFQGKDVLASVSDDKTIRLWNRATGELLTTLQGYSGNITALATHRFTGIWPSKKEAEELLIAASDDGNIYIWNLITRKISNILCGSSAVRALAMSTELLISGGDDKIVRIWNLENGTLLRKFEALTEKITSLVIRKSQQLLIGNDDGTIRIVDAKTGAVNVLPGHSTPIRALALMKDEELLASTSDDHMIRIWDLSTGKTIHVLQGHTDKVVALTVGIDKRYLTSASADKTIRRWNLDQISSLKKAQGPLTAINAFALLRGGQQLATAGNDGTIGHWNLKTRELHKILQAHTKSTRTVAPVFEGEKLVSGGGDKVIRIWDLESNSFKSLQASSPINVIISRGKQLVSGGIDKNISIWNLETDAILQTLQGVTPIKAPSTSSLSKGTSRFAWRSWSKSTEPVEVKPNPLSPQGHTDEVTALSFLKDNELLASGGKDGALFIWDLSIGKIRKSLEGHTAAINALALWVLTLQVMPSIKGGQHMISASTDSTIRIWNTVTGKTVNILKGHTDSVETIALLQGGMRLASGGRDKTIRVWSMKGGANTSKISLSHAVHSLVFEHPDRLFAATADGGVWCWQLNALKNIEKSTLLWATRPSLLCDAIELSTRVGVGMPDYLSKENLLLIQQHDAKTKIA